MKRNETRWHLQATHKKFNAVGWQSHVGLDSKKLFNTLGCEYGN